MLKKMLLTILITITLIVISVFYLKIQRETSVWKEEIEVADNIKVPIEFMSSRRKYYGDHGFGFGGGGDQGAIGFNYNSVFYSYKSSCFLPIVIKLYEGDFYIVSFDRTDMKKIIFRFYKSSDQGTFKEIESVLFPKTIAIQNRWFKGVNNIEEKDPNKILRNSLTAKIWCRLEANIFYYKQKHSASKEIVERYKEKYLSQ